MHFLKAETVIEKGVNRLNREIFLIHRPAGEYPAGSRTIPWEERWGVIWEFEGSRHGQWHASPGKARDDFDTRNVGADV